MNESKNPKSQFAVNFNIEDVRTALLRLKTTSNITVTYIDTVSNTARIHKPSNIDLGYNIIIDIGYNIDFKFEQVFETITKIEIEVSQNLDTIKPHEWTILNLNRSNEVKMELVAEKILNEIIENFSKALNRLDSIKRFEAETLKSLTEKDEEGDLKIRTSKNRLHRLDEFHNELLDKTLADLIAKSIEDVRLLNSKGFYLTQAGLFQRPVVEYRYFENEQDIHIHKKGPSTYVFTKPGKPEGNFFQKLFKSAPRQQSQEFTDLKDCIQAALS